MHYILFFALILSCSSEKKNRGSFTPTEDNEERISHDWDEDGYPETILISPSRNATEYRELVIYRGVPDETPKEIIFTNKNLIPRRARPGGSLRLQKDFSFTLTVDSSASGRTGEVMTWKVSWRRGRFLLTGMARDWKDKLDPNDHKSCDVDLRSGRGSKNGKLIKFQPITVDLIDLNEKFIPSICQF